MNVFLVNNGYGKTPKVFSSWKLAEEELITDFRGKMFSSYNSGPNNIFMEIQQISVDYNNSGPSLIKYSGKCFFFANMKYILLERAGKTIVEETLTRYSVDGDGELLCIQLDLGYVGNPRTIYFNDLSLFKRFKKERKNFDGKPEKVTDPIIQKCFKYQCYCSPSRSK